MSLITIKNMLDWVEENIKRNPTLDEMSNFVGYSPFYCSAKFHEHVGMTFKQYLAQRRLSLATEEVKNSRRKLVDIAMDYGYSSPEVFTRAFVKAYGCTPFQYRKELPKLILFQKPLVHE